MSDSELPPAARAFVEEDADLLPSALTAAQGAALVDLLRSRGDAVRLTRLGDAADKALAKAARKALHLLRTQGVAAPAVVKREFRPVGPHAPAEDLSLASSIDGYGERVVWLVRVADDVGFDVFEARLSESHGLLEFIVANAPRREWRQHAARVIGDGLRGVARTSERHARALIEGGYQRTIAARRSVPESFAQARLSLGHYEPETRHPALDVAPPYAIEESRGRLGALHELPEVGLWIPPEEALSELELQIGAVVTSKLILDPKQRRQRVYEAIARVADERLTVEWRRRLAERLNETALLLAARGSLEEARLCTTAALLTLDAGVPAAENPFVARLFEKVIRVPESTPEPPAAELSPEPGSLILKP
jgi:hypothetical protein